MTSMERMFARCSTFSQDLRRWDVSRIQINLHDDGTPDEDADQGWQSMFWETPAFDLDLVPAGLHHLGEELTL